MNGGLDLAWPIVGHQDIKKYLSAVLSGRQPSQAYLFYGADGVGKKAVAELFAQALICEKYNAYSLGEVLPTEAFVPCGVCANCQQFQKGVFPDFYRLVRENNPKTGEKRGNLTVDQIREVQGQSKHRSFNQGYKVFIIEEAETLKKEAANCLLKTLEEPAGQTVFILISSAREALLPTILSRCQSLHFLPVQKKELYDYLLKLGADRDLAKDLAQISVGRASVAINYFHNKEVWQERVLENKAWLELLGQSQAKQFQSIEAFVKNNNSDDLLLKKLDELALIVRDLLILKINPRAEALQFKMDLLVENLLATHDEIYWCNLLKKIPKTKSLIKQNITPKLALENLIINS